jgi:hypothetical protein
VVIEDHLAAFPLLGQTKKGSLLVWVNWLAPDPNNLKGNMVDTPKKQAQPFTLQYISGTPAQLICHIDGNGEGFVAAPGSPGITLPIDFTLIKQ